VVQAVEQRTDDPQRRIELIDELVGFEPPRRHGLRNMFLFWAGAIGASALAGVLGLPRWWGFVAALLAFGWLARLLATRALLWRLDQLLPDSGESRDSQA
jgi:hypothetical protein